MRAGRHSASICAGVIAAPPATWTRFCTVPGEIPLEFPTEMMLSINLKTAKTLCITLPPALLGVADEVIG